MERSTVIPRVQVQQLMDRFERDFENLDVHTATMERTMDGTTVLNAPKSQVDALIQEAADQAGYVQREAGFVLVKSEGIEKFLIISKEKN